MPRVVSIAVSGLPRAWSFYTIYCAGGRHLASRRGVADLGWPAGRQVGMKDGMLVEVVGLVRTRGDPAAGFVTVNPCALQVSEEGEPLLVEVEDEPA